MYIFWLSATAHGPDGCLVLAQNRLTHVFHRFTSKIAYFFFFGQPKISSNSAFRVAEIIARAFISRNLLGELV